MKKITVSLLSMTILLGIVFTACKKDSSAPPVSALYTRLGGNAGITKVINDFIGNVVGDTVINKFFAITVQSQERVDDLKMNLVDLVGQTVGGTEKYTGLSMKAAHIGMGIKDKHFQALVGDLVKSLKSNGVSDADIQTIGAALAPLEADILG